LNPEWISHGVYKIINWVNENKSHNIHLKDFEQVFQQDTDRYPKDDSYEFLYKLMLHYELVYESADDCLIIPHLLNEDRPKVLPVFEIGDSLMLRYEAESPLPPHTISRFIVRENLVIKKDEQGDIAWRYGVVLEDKQGNLALVREETHSIRVSVKGMGKTEYIDKLRKTLNEIFDSYQSEKPELKYNIIRFGEMSDAQVATKDEPIWLNEEKIIKHVLRVKPFYDVETDQDISMKPTFNQFNIEIKDNAQLHFADKIDHSTTNIFNFYDCNIELQGLVMNWQMN